MMECAACGNSNERLEYLNKRLGFLKCLVCASLVKYVHHDTYVYSVCMQQYAG